MSDSRLEKFIYAICSMDVTDLPVPLSRIEKLWNCLITGETPDFEPLSRNEKYLMAMLDRYDISNLPAPMSRGEKLLYKIVVGETDLSDVPGYLSRYEELLKYLIENGGISGGDFEYVLYTLNQSMYTLYTTAEKPVKSAILKGQTLVNLKYREEAINNSKKFVVVENLIENKQYIAIFPHIANAKYAVYKGSGSVGFIVDYTPSSKLIFTAPQSPVDVRLYVAIDDTTMELPSNALDIVCVEYQQGMENWDIPYFEGMQSVKMPVLTTGNNLFDGKIEFGSINGAGILVNSNIRIRSANYIKISPLSKYYLKCLNDNCVLKAYYSYNENKEYIEQVIPSNNYFTTKENCHFIKFIFGKEDNTPITEINQLITLTYNDEPYKSNILTVNEEVTLRGIGNVQDTLDCLTGEVTQRVGEIVLDGSEGWLFNSVALYAILALDDYSGLANNICMNNRLPQISIYGSEDSINNNRYGLMVGTDKSIRIRLADEQSGQTLVGIKQYLQQNPITVHYQLATESVKTVDLTVVDQDNQPTELGTFENVTHVSLVAENLIPEVEMEVATNLLEDTVFNLTNAFNTLYPTAAKPVKSAILKGNTLANVAKQVHIVNNVSQPISDYITLVHTGNENYKSIRLTNNGLLKPNTKYLMIFDVAENTLSSKMQISKATNLWGFETIDMYLINAGQTGIIKHIVTSKSDLTNVTDYLYLSTLFGEKGDGTQYIKLRMMVIEYQEGMENWDIPYFEGMKSVQMPVLTTVGKNLFDGKMELGSITTKGIPEDSVNCLRSVNFIKIKPSTLYTITNDLGYTMALYEYDSDFNFIKNKTYNKAYTTLENTAYIKIKTSASKVETDLNVKFQIEEGYVGTSYEPFKSNILTVNEEVELRGIGDVKDELNLLTGELTQRVGEAVLDGSENWSLNYEGNSDLLTFSLNYFPSNIVEHRFENSSQYLLSDSLPITTDFKNIIGILSHRLEGNHWIVITVKRNELTSQDVAGFKQFLSSNPIKIQYRITESVKTVDLTTVNQDGNETKLRTFDDTTHVLLNSEGLIPTAALTVRTKIPSASSTSLLMDDILTNQQQLETTVDEQSENVDATMIATTEIFEETL